MRAAEHLTLCGPKTRSDPMILTASSAPGDARVGPTFPGTLVGPHPNRSGVPSGKRGRPGRAPQQAKAKIRGCAVLHVGGIESLVDRRWPREVAVELLDEATVGEHVTLSWLVTSEAFWKSKGGISRLRSDVASSPGPGHGLPPTQVACELAEVVRGRRVYSECHVAIRHWIETLFSEAELGEPPFVVRDLRSLALTLRPDPEDIRSAGVAANRTVRFIPRAACEALRHAEFVRFLAAHVDSHGTRPTAAGAS